MSSESETLQSNFKIAEFSKQHGQADLFYQILSMKNSIYCWVGTESGEHGSLAATFPSRIDGIEGKNSPASVLVGGACQELAQSASSRIHAKLKMPVFLSLNIPDDQILLTQIEKTIIEKVSSNQ